MDNPHKGHRERLRKRFLKEGFSSFDDHNILELALFYVIRQRDTNEIAHALIHRFGSVAGVLEASREELKEVDGVSDATATFFQVIAEMAKVYYNSDPAPKARVLNHSDQIGEYFVRKFLGAKKELIYLLMLDNGFHELGCEKIGEGTLTSASLNTREIAEMVLRCRAVHVILAHNHLVNGPAPSNEDIVATSYLQAALGHLDVDVTDHIIVSGRSYASLKNLDYL